MMAPELALGTTEFTIQVGKTKKETFMHMLTSIKGITQPIAKGIVGEYSTIKNLYDGWNECHNEKAKREMLVGIWVSFFLHENVEKGELISSMLSRRIIIRMVL